MRILLVAASLAFVLALTGIGNGQEQQSSSGKHGRSLEIDPAFVAGNWRVAKVRTEPDMDVAALADDDPPYMGANLAFSAEAITWATSQTNGQGTYDNCSLPGYAPDQTAPGAYVVICGADDWGASASLEATLTATDRNTMVLKWYDGGLLTLKRVGGR